MKRRKISWVSIRLRVRTVFNVVLHVLNHFSAGIHGLPKAEWFGIPGRKDSAGDPGYCNHGTGA